MTYRNAARKFAVGVLATVSTGGALVGLAGTASASPVPGVPFTTAEECTHGGGTVASTIPGAPRCEGGGDHGDVVVSDAEAHTLQGIIPRPPVPGPALPG